MKVQLQVTTHIDRAIVKLLEYLGELLIKGGNDGPDLADFEFLFLSLHAGIINVPAKKHFF